MVLYTGNSPDDATRWPNSGWISGTIADLSILTQSATIPPNVIEMAADELVAGVSEAAAMLDEMSITHAGAMQKICAELRQADGEQTRRMATTILANAFMFQESLAGGDGGLSDVKSIENHLWVCEIGCPFRMAEDSQSELLADLRHCQKIVGGGSSDQQQVIDREARING